MRMPSKHDLLQAQLERQMKSAETSAKARAREKEAGYVRVTQKVNGRRKELAVGMFKGIAAILDREQNGELDLNQAMEGVLKLIRKEMMGSGHVAEAVQTPDPVDTETTHPFAPTLDDGAEEE